MEDESAVGQAHSTEAREDGRGADDCGGGDEVFTRAGAGARRGSSNPSADEGADGTFGSTNGEDDAILAASDS